MTSPAATILIVDDEIHNRKLLEVLLRPEGYLTQSAANGEEALAAVAERAPGLILLDVVMPGMDGYQVASTLKANPATANIPIIMVTAQTDRSARLAGLNAGAEDFLTKPVDRAELWLRVRNLLRLKAFDDFLHDHNLILERRVTERTADLEAAIKKLRESEDRYRDLVENSQDLICTHTLQGKLLSVNAAAARLTGYAQETLLRMNMADLLTRGTRDGFAAYLNEIRTTGAARGLMRIRTASGETRWWEYNNTLRTQDVVAPVVRGMAQDITERKEAEKELLARELRYRAVVTSAPNAFVTSDDDGRIVGWNPSAERIFGYAETEVIGQPLTLLIPQRFLDRHLDGIKRVQSGGEKRAIGKTVELTGRRKDSSEFPLELSLSEWSVGEARFFNGIIRDITERKVAEAKLQRLSQLYAALSQCNEAIVRCASEEELFPQICRAAVQFGGMKLAWIGIVDTETLMVRPVADFGDDTGYLRDLNMSADANSSRGHSATGTAIRENQPFWCQDFLNDPLTVPWRERATRAGFAASASLPLHGNGVVIGAFSLYSGEANAFDEAARDLLSEMATDINFALDNFAREAARERAEEDIRRYVEQLKTAFMSTVEVATTLSGMRDPYTAGHARRVATIAVAIGAELGFDARRQEGLQVAGHLHDIGKITIPSEILSKPGKISAIEFELIQGHAQAGYDVLKGVEFPWPVAEVALQHHERMDGNGYPQGLKGEAILLEARIIAIADVVESMSSHRPYRPAFGIDKALAEIERGRGTAYDADASDACLRLFREKRYQLAA